VKEGMVYFGVRIEPHDKAGVKRSSGVGYSNGGKDSHDFSVHDQKFKQQMEGLQKFLEMSEQADSIKLARIAHIDFAAWLLQYLEEVKWHFGARGCCHKGVPRNKNIVYHLYRNCQFSNLRRYKTW